MSEAPSDYRRIRFSGHTDSPNDFIVIYTIDDAGNSSGIYDRLSSRADLELTLEQMRTLILSQETAIAHQRSSLDRQSTALLTLLRQHAEVFNQYLATIGPDATGAQREHLDQLARIGISLSQLFLVGKR